MQKQLSFPPFPCGFYGASQVTLVVKNPPANTGDVRDMGPILRSLRVLHFLKEEMATHSSIPAWRIPWTGRLQFIGSQRVIHD